MTKDEALKDISVIPQGMYCYTPKEIVADRFKIDPCPYWEKKENLPEQECGYCNYLEDGDKGGTMLLWDMVKECGVKDD